METPSKLELQLTGRIRANIGTKAKAMCAMNAFCHPDKKVQFATRYYILTNTDLDELHRLSDHSHEIHRILTKYPNTVSEVLVRWTDTINEKNQPDENNEK